MRIIEVHSCHDCLYQSQESSFGKRFCLDTGEDITENVRSKTFHKDCPLNDYKNE